MKEYCESKRGITLIALIITIIILLILAGVSISMVVGENGVLNRAQDASQKTRFASEKEAIEFVMSDIKTGIMINEEIPKEKYIGEKLSKMSSVTGNWKNVIVGDITYSDGWYLLEKGKDITGYGEATNNWLINYNTGELKELKDGEYTTKNADASGAIVDTSLALNINPSNLKDTSNWGTGVSFVGGDGTENSGVKDTEIKFDGVDDYLRIDNVKVEKSSGITFEFYCNTDSDVEGVTPLCKTYFDDNGSVSEGKNSNFRSGFDAVTHCLVCCFGQGDSESNISGGGSNSHWLNFTNVEFENGQKYISIIINFDSGEVKAYENGQLKQETVCSKTYLESGDLFNLELPFTVGLATGGNTWKKECSKLDLYACRLYTRVLDDEEIKYNFDKTTESHNKLVNGQTP